MAKKILGLDLGSSSAGWAVVNYSDKKEELEILGMGLRPIPIDTDSLNEFSSGSAITLNAQRTQQRTARKMIDRFQARKADLMKFLAEIGATPSEELMLLSREELWALRSKAATEELTLPELGRVLLHLAQKRGYNASKADLSQNDKENSEYKKSLSERFNSLLEANQTIGQFYHERLSENPNFRIKGRVLPRQAYKIEFDTIMQCQQKFHPDVLTEANISLLKDHILFYQRPLKSCKHLVKRCEFEEMEIVKDGKKQTIGPKVAHRSNPLFQYCRLLQVVNGIRLISRKGEADFIPNKEQRRLLLLHLNSKKLKKTDIYKILLNKTKTSDWRAQDNVGDGIPGNETLMAIKTALQGKYDENLDFNITYTDAVDHSTGEIRRQVSDKVIDENLYKLWHVLYSISNIEDLQNVLKTKFGIADESVIEALVSIDFTKLGYGNMSIKAIRKILPYLEEGLVYSEACQRAGINHSDSITKEEELQRELSRHIAPIKKGELRQPVVEKVLNHTISIVNALTDKYGAFDEIHIELARELKSSKDERKKDSSRNTSNKNTNYAISERLKKEYGLTPTRGRINKLKMWEESNHCCIYCGKNIENATAFLNGIDSEVEHIIPRSLLFDDSFTNKVCSCTECNRNKNNRTAYDFMASKGEKVLAEYRDRVIKLNDEKKISDAKLKKLLTPGDQIPEDFIDRQLRESQYIAREAMKKLREICHDVIATSGSVTDCVRHLWGWDKVLHNLNFERYEKADLVEPVPEDIKDANANEMRIIGWDKRCDHRHHAIDALAIACTNRSIIQRLNHLNTLRDESFKPWDAQGEDARKKKSLVEKFILSLPHFNTATVAKNAAEIFVAFPTPARPFTTSKRYSYSGKKRRCLQTEIIVPRGSLHEETVRGKIKRYNKNGQLEEQVVVKLPLSKLNAKNANSIVDKHIRELILERFAKDPKNPFATPIYSDKEQKQEIKSVRCFTPATSLVTVKHDPEGRPIGFANPGSNHHVAIYTDENGLLQESVTSFFNVVLRHRYGLPAIVENPEQIWT